MPSSRIVTFDTVRREPDHRERNLMCRTLGLRVIPSLELLMAYVITDSCIKDLLCADVCPTDCIHPKKDEPGFEAATQLYVDPAGCIDCGACVPVCTSDSIYAADDLPAGLQPFVDTNAVYFAN